MKAREGDLIETLEGNIFDVKGLVHPQERVIAFIRFTPDPTGDRKRGNVTYRKVYPLHERYELLHERFPQYLVHDPVFNELLCEVPINGIKKHYRPTVHLRALRQKRQLTQLEKATVSFSELLKKNSDVPWSKLGISGSLLIGLYTPKSDIDLIVYGTQSSCRVYDSLKALTNHQSSQVKSYDTEELKRLFDFRSKDTAMALKDFVRTESRKVLQGRFNGHDYYIRCVKDWNEIDEQYGTAHYRSMGYAKIKAEIIVDSQRIFTPCNYKIDKVETVEGPKSMCIEEIVSFRGRFCELPASNHGEPTTVEARGKIEQVTNHKTGKQHYRLLVGNTPQDYIITKD